MSGKLNRNEAGQYTGNPLPWLEAYDRMLETPDGCLKLLSEVVKATWQGRLGGRSGGVINHALRMKIDYWTGAKRIKQLEDDLAEIIQLLPTEIRRKYEEANRNESEST